MFSTFSNKPSLGLSTAQKKKKINRNRPTVEPIVSTLPTRRHAENDDWEKTKTLSDIYYNKNVRLGNGIYFATVPDGLRQTARRVKNTLSTIINNARPTRAERNSRFVWKERSVSRVYCRETTPARRPGDEGTNNEHEKKRLFGNGETRLVASRPANELVARWNRRV